MLMLKGIFSSLLPFSNIFFSKCLMPIAGIEGDQGMEFYANDLFKIWPSIFFLKMGNFRLCKYSRPCFIIFSCMQFFGISVLFATNVHFTTRSYPTSTKLHIKTSMAGSFLSTFAGLPGRFTCCLEQRFQRKSVSACFCRRELYGRRYHGSLKNTSG